MFSLEKGKPIAIVKPEKQLIYIDDEIKQTQVSKPKMNNSVRLSDEDD